MRGIGRSFNYWSLILRVNDQLVFVSLALFIPFNDGQQLLMFIETFSDAKFFQFELKLINKSHKYILTFHYYFS